MTVQVLFSSFANNFNRNMHIQYTYRNEVFNGGGQLNKHTFENITGNFTQQSFSVCGKSLATVIYHFIFTCNKSRTSLKQFLYLL